VANPLLKVLYKGKLFHLLHYANPYRLTVLCYHRIDDPFNPNFQTFKPNVSTTAEGFSEQISFLQSHFNILSQDQLISWLEGRSKLPPYPAMITFDDGYRDNFLHAYPLLKSRGVPATIFLATNYIEKAKPFAWDMAAYCFFHTDANSVDLPFLGERHWANAQERDNLLQEWFEVLKTYPEQEKQNAIEQLPALLNVTISDSAFAHMHLTWDEVREMSNNGITMGAHTMSHPILTRIPLSSAQQELLGSKERVESELEKPVKSFAYPNGGHDDFNKAIKDFAHDIGIQVAFSLINGPSSQRQALRDPLEIRRIFIGYKDTMPRFVAKVCGIMTWQENLRNLGI
jgi:peptidoglycan/xylan/chitin deacetylase (PgdA/CDA1 family)